MENPYKTPEAEITPDTKQESARIGWKIFFVVVLIAQLFSFADSADKLLIGEYESQYILDFIIYPFVLLALFGYAFKRRFFKRIIWKLLLPITMMGDFYFLYMERDLLFTADPIAMVIISLLLVTLFSLQYTAMYRYGYSNDVPWLERQNVTK